ncbi:response regulator transcription factor [Rhizobium sp. BK181]|uniref:response regulator transcription factor n=1 Tax=Rhizobium sp. BK181 TaxID=2587072 RepID=UPI001FED490F|nr:helix-turn-helix transcriptional regulator [Rhizobium sp. BK181]
MRGSGEAKLLSLRELECLRWSAAGKSSDEIAIILSLSSHTVTAYLKTAMKKLDVKTRLQAVVVAYRLKLLCHPDWAVRPLCCHRLWRTTASRRPALYEMT